MRDYIKKSIVILPAVLVLGLGCGLTIASCLGSDTHTSFLQGIGRYINMQPGTLTTIYNVAVLIIYFFINRKFIGTGSILIGFCLGPFMNIFSNMFSFVASMNLFGKIVVDVIGVILVAIALSWYIPLEAGLQPLDMVKQSVSKLTKKTYGFASYVVSGIDFIGALITGGDIGIGTVISFVAVGYLCDKFMPVLKPIAFKMAGINKED